MSLEPIALEVKFPEKYRVLTEFEYMVEPYSRELDISFII